MSAYTHLIGAEQVSSAGHQMEAAAETIRIALSNHEAFLMDWLRRFEEVLAQNAEAAKS